MPRWEPGTRDRLERAALELFRDRGYDRVTVADIAERAGVTKATYFRTFADKREVLFWGQSLLAGLLADGIRDAPEEASTPELLAAGIANLATAFPGDRHALAATRDAIVADHEELRERLARKRVVLRDAIEGALVARGVDPTEAAVAAELGRAAFSTAYARWAHAPDPSDFAPLVRTALDELLTAAARLASGTAPRRPG